MGFDRLIAARGWSMALAGRIQTLRRLGNNAAMRSDLAELERRYKEGMCSPSILAWAYLAAGEVEPALACMENAFTQRDSRLTLFFHLSPFDAIRDDERFVRILRQMNLAA